MLAFISLGVLHSACHTCIYGVCDVVWPCMLKDFCYVVITEISEQFEPDVIPIDEVKTITV
jgi:hypothetical protein